MPKVQKAQNTKKGSRAIPLSVPSPQIPTQSNGHIAPLGLHSSPNIFNSLGTNASDFFEKKGVFEEKRATKSMLPFPPLPVSLPKFTSKFDRSLANIRNSSFAHFFRHPGSSPGFICWDVCVLCSNPQNGFGPFRLPLQSPGCYALHWGSSGDPGRG